MQHVTIRDPCHTALQASSVYTFATALSEYNLRLSILIFSHWCLAMREFIFYTDGGVYVKVV